MTENSYPFAPRVVGTPDSGSVATPDRWSTLMRQFATDGVFDPPNLDGILGALVLVPAADALAVDMDTGLAIVRGFAYENTAILRKNIPTAHATLPRNDRLVLRLVITGGQGTVTAQVLAGTPLATPVLPALTRTSTLYEKSIGAWRVNPGAGVATSLYPASSLPGVTFYPDAARYSSGSLSRHVGPALPYDDVAVAYEVGERFTLIGSDGRALNYIWMGTRAYGWDPADPSTGWCIEPGQILASKPYTDSGGRHLTNWQTIGDNGGSGDSPALITYAFPSVMPGHGFEVRYQHRIATATGSTGDLITTTVFSYNLARPVGEPSNTLSFQTYGPGYNPSMHGAATFLAGDGDWGAVSRGTKTLVIAETLPTGLVQSYAGKMTLHSV